MNEILKIEEEIIKYEEYFEAKDYFIQFDEEIAITKILPKSQYQILKYII